MNHISQDFLDFVSRHRHENPADLKLKFADKNMGFSLDFAITQIDARRRAVSKIPSFVENPNFIFPSSIAAEQASNEAVARYHASLIGNANVLDMTAGLGIDDMSMAAAGASVVACEIDPLKCDALLHNAAVFGLKEHLSVVCGDSIEYLRTSTLSFDVIFADPARRSSSGARTHALADCTPDILKAMPLIMAKTGRLLVKASPMLDISEIKKTVENLYHIHVVCFRGECKEVLLDIRPDNHFEGISVIDLDWHSPISRFEISSHLTPDSSPLTLDSSPLTLDSSPLTPDSSPLTLDSSPLTLEFLYEPNAGIMKTGAWDELLAKYTHLVKAAPNTHLFLSDTLYEDFPGRVMQILSVPDKKALKELKGNKINVASRNYPLSAPQLEKKLGVKPGGELQLYAFRLSFVPTIFITRPLQISRP